jgi:peroxiredoxin
MLSLACTFSTHHCAAQQTAAPSPVPDVASAATPAKPAPAYESDPKFQKALEAAKQKVSLQADERLARWKKASKIAQGQCVECLREVVKYQVRLQEWKDALGTVAQLEAIAVEPEDKFYVSTERGQLLMHSNGEQPKPDQLKQAVASLEAALVIHPNNRIALYQNGRALAMLGRYDEAKAQFQHYLDRASESDHYRLRVEHFIDNPHLAALPMAPPFTVVTSEGEEFNLDDMNGKVVLLDFWATWCGPCNESLPELKKIAKDFANEPLVVISISQDHDPAAWKEFIAKHEMTWPQYRDADNALGTAYGVHAIPHYFTIDADGVLTTEMVGTDSDVRGKLKKLIAHAKDEQQKKAAATDKAGQ